MNTTIPEPSIPHKHLSHFLQAGLWLLKTAIFALVTPFVLAALVIAIVSVVLDTSVESVRQAMTVFATMDAGSWMQLGQVWQTYALICYSFVVFFRLIYAAPVTTLSKRISDSIDAWFEQKMDWLESKVKFTAMRGSVVVLTVLVAAAVFILSRPVTAPAFPESFAQSTLPKPAAPPASAAIALPGGEVKSGVATVERESDARYIVTFHDMPGR